MAVNPLGPFRDRQEREKHIVEYVTETLNGAETETNPDRERWKQSEDLFNGIMDWGDENTQDEWRSRIFLHEYAPIIREAAIQITNQIFQNPRLISVETDAFENQELRRIREKLLFYYLEDVRFRHKFYEYAVAGCIYGIATWKLNVNICPYLRPEVVIEQIERSEEQQIKRISSSQVDKPSYAVSDNPEEIEGSLAEVMDKLLGREKGARYLPPTVKAKKQLEMKMDLRLVNPLNYFWMPDADDLNCSPWHAERTFTPFFQLVPLFESGFLDPRLREDVLKRRGGVHVGGFALSSSYEMLKMRQRNQTSNKTRYSQIHEVIEYFGPLLDKQGDQVPNQENCHFIVIDGKHVVRDDINRSWTGRPPFFSTVWNRRPFKAAGAGIADNGAAQQVLINQLFSLFIDAVKFDLNSAKVVNSDMIVDPSQLETGLQPGMLIEAFNGKAQDAFSDIPQSSDTAAQLFQTIESLKLSMQKGSSVNTMTSNPASRARISAQEIQSNDARRSSAINALGFEVDNCCIRELAERIDDLVLQYGFSSENLELLASRNVLSQSEYQLVADIPQVERFREVYGHFKIVVKGFSAAIEKQEHLSRFAEWIQQLNQMPPEAKANIDWTRVVQDGTDFYGFDGNAWIRQNNPQDKAREENALLKLNQMVAVWDQDDDTAHLPVHYELVMQVGPIDAIRAHILGHLQRVQASGRPIPQPPPEVAQALGLQPPGAAPGGPPQSQRALPFNPQAQAPQF
jgi:hypothetical protein